MVANDGITVTFRYWYFCYMFHFVPLWVFDFVAFPAADLLQNVVKCGVCAVGCTMEHKKSPPII